MEHDALVKSLHGWFGPVLVDVISPCATQLKKTMNQYNAVIDTLSWRAHDLLYVKQTVNHSADRTSV